MDLAANGTFDSPGDDGGFDADEAAARLDLAIRTILSNGALAWVSKPRENAPDYIEAFVAGAAWAACFRWE